jgi:hypothetical protein
MAFQAGLSGLDFMGIRERKRKEYFAAVQAGKERDYEPMKNVFRAVLSRTRHTCAALKAVFILATIFMACSAATWTPSIDEEETVTVSTIRIRISGSLRKGLVSSNGLLDMSYYTIKYRYPERLKE